MNGHDNQRDQFDLTWRRRFEGFAEKHPDDAGVAGWSPSGLETRLRYFRRWWSAFQRGAAGTWLDAGCGAGTYTAFLRAEGLEVIGLDYSEPTINRARQRVSGAQAWLIGDGTALPIRDGAVDGVICFGVTQAISSSTPLVQELCRVVRRGGTLWLDGLNRWCLPHLLTYTRYRLTGKHMRLRYESPFALRRRLAQAFGSEVDLYWMPMLPGRLSRWQESLESRLARNVFRRIVPLSLLLSHSFMLRARKAVQEIVEK